MDIEEDKEVPLILDRLFIKTARDIIDVDEGKLKVRAQDDEGSFNVFDGLKHSIIGKDCLRTYATNKPFLKLKNSWTFQIL